MEYFEYISNINGKKVTIEFLLVKIRQIELGQKMYLFDWMQFPRQSPMFSFKLDNPGIQTK